MLIAPQLVASPSYKRGWWCSARSNGSKSSGGLAEGAVAPQYFQGEERALLGSGRIVFENLEPFSKSVQL